MFQNNILPIGESGKHFPLADCPCGPKIIEAQGQKWLMHFSFDHREIWLGVEQMLGITCYEHMEFVDENYERGRPHRHVPKPEPYYEYPHEKIDPR